MHKREKKFCVTSDDGLVKTVVAEMEDEYHHIVLTMGIESDQLRIARIDLDMIRHPEPTCKACEENLRGLTGISVQHPRFRQKLLKVIGGERGCFHVLELLYEIQDYTRSIFWDQRPDNKGHYEISKAGHKGTVRCIAFCKR
ncbi:MAG: DUF2889 domain-containing protein [Deltaproteobacteria bacterium]|nr:DUF2889 domain-containing protein [Deltaproteobacteria bacterium]